MKSTTKAKASAKATLAVDYTPEMAAARDQVREVGRKYRAYVNRGDGALLEECVKATQHALAAGFLVDGRTPDALPGSVGKAEYGRMFGLSSGSEVTFWQRLSKALDAGVSIGDDLWKRLATRNTDGKGKTLPTGARLAKRSEVGKVIDGGGSIADIIAACDAEVAKAKDRAARTPASAKDSESPAEGIPTSDDPVADALLAILGLGQACKRIPTEDVDGWAKVRKALTEVMRRESTLRQPAKAPAKRTRRAASTEARIAS